MASNRDYMTRKVKRATKNVNQRRAQEGKSPMRPAQVLNEYDAYGGIGQNKGAQRKLGRRGVRARARLARMSQPSGGTITNSP